MQTKPSALVNEVKAVGNTEVPEGVRVSIFLRKNPNQDLPMQKKLPEVIAVALTVIAFIYPPWRMYISSDGKYATIWESIFRASGDGPVDVALLGLEFAAIAGLYFLLKKIVDKE